jgi:hypothetical protein
VLFTIRQHGLRHYQGRFDCAGGVDKYAAMLKMPHTRKFDLTGKPLKGWVMVLSEALDSDKVLTDWLQRAVSFVKTLPPK